VEHERGVAWGPADSASPLESPWSFGAFFYPNACLKSNHGFGGNSSHAPSAPRSSHCVVIPAQMKGQGLGWFLAPRLLGGAVGLGHNLWCDRDWEQADVERATTEAVARKPRVLRVSVSGTKPGRCCNRTAGKPLIRVLGRRLIPVSDVTGLLVLYIRGEKDLFF